MEHTKMKAIPLPTDFVLEIDIPREQAVSQLAAKTKGASPKPSGSAVWFVGNVDPEGFRVKEAAWYLKNYVPTFYGRFFEGDNQTVIRMRAQNFTSIFTASFMWLCVLAFSVGGCVNLIHSDMEAAGLCGVFVLGFTVANLLSVGFYQMKVEDGRRKLSSVWGASEVATGTSKGIGRNRGKPSD